METLLLTSETFAVTYRYFCFGLTDHQAITAGTAFFLVVMQVDEQQSRQATIQQRPQLFRNRPAGVAFHLNAQSERCAVRREKHDQN